LILDEPTTGLDPLREAVFTEWIGRIRAEGRTVLLSSHILAEVEKLCDTVTIIRAGRTVETGSLDQMRHLSRSTVTLTTSADPASLTALAGVHGMASDGHRVTFSVDDAALGEVMNAAATLGIESLVCSPPSLEELFLRHYSQAGAPAPAASGPVR
ncbi:MAG: ABC transporter ATP-binding protein, partial [Bifidobacteriaceae bacterium]|nr:ABC transporter ATP-binding protein [Bifidobacteriaceae bacterium]